MPGNMTDLTDELAVKLCYHLERGNYRVTAAALCGIAPTTLSRWMHKEGEPYESLQRMVRIAEAQAEADSLSVVMDSMEPKDRQWYLARRHPDRWAETKRIDLQGRLELGVTLDASVFTDPDARAHLQGFSRFLLTRDQNNPSHSEPSEPGEDS